MSNWTLPDLGPAIYLLVIWEAFWKGLGLWRSAKKGDTLWFIGIFLTNLFGLIPIFYLWRTKQLEPALKDIQHFFKSKFHKK
ncbi:hypothetical protein A3J19_01435 [Candidatus Daviesbacteria bacterium RIFCSPLOWO2_02_FULL_41_8]|uniref:DUF5652 domain-containing protein n=2 Tax=Candidatus Daviesiibacteriota TaxID=1752718 RepID=A0A1F5NHH5_9BACT|nr:MAG: hypothetical protein A2871_04340 [Candidatus Daviesbacteria bacterium RIFCSPHIGHO2_01_FULL_41_23]OGE62238.1 MAG: hypothetical protein A2967_02135 [Candidatus Daviesbacteria bacterium RIFCSPLOWO2_01_FULL_41_32]OGE77075.1 MAG: hypothetical protein A3J19_01435 [Candidatus Daviesbacteria bacterium RIFCSPLOWO2_02_FULL_41_8]